MGGCGCGKNRNNKIAKANAARKKSLSQRLIATSKHRSEKIERRKLVENKIKFCRSCPHSQPTKDERRRNVRVCHKTNTSIQGVLNTKTFKCPIGNF